MVDASPARQLNNFIRKYAPEVGALARAALARLRRQIPWAVELVYDNYNALVIAFGPSERASEAVLSIALYPRYINLFFLRGARLTDPHELLRGAGSQVRCIHIEDATVLDSPPVRALISQALKAALKPMTGGGRRRLVIRSVSAKQRPRRPEK